MALPKPLSHLKSGVPLLESRESIHAMARLLTMPDLFTASCFIAEKRSRKARHLRGMHE
jgi:hypothetical protein